VLAAATVEFLAAQSAYRVTSNPTSYYFFFRSGFPTLSDRISAYRSILAQTLQGHRQDHDMIDRFAFMMNEVSDGQTTASPRELTDLFEICITSIGQCVLIFDGMDECQDADDLVTDLIRFSTMPEVKLVMFGRPNERNLIRSVLHQQQLNIARSTSNDIALYSGRCLRELVHRNLLPKEVNVTEFAVRLTNAADGMFLWAHLMMKYLNSWVFTPLKRVNIILNISLPEGLEVMYNRIADLISQGNEDEQSLAMKIITWISCAERILTVDEMHQAIKHHSDSGEECVNADNDIPNFNQAVVMICAGLVEQETVFSPDHGLSISTFRFCHLSVREFFLVETTKIGRNAGKKSQMSMHLSCIEAEAHCEISRTCLRYLMLSTPAQSLSGTLGFDARPTQLDSWFPFLRYAALTWIRHLAKIPALNPNSTSAGPLISVQARQLLLELSRFMGQKLTLMAWIEASYTYAVIPDIQTLLDWGQRQSNLVPEEHLEKAEFQFLFQDVVELALYLANLDRYWTTKLTQSPGCIWDEVTAFTPSRFLAQTTATIVKSLVATSPREAGLSTKYLRRISETTSDGQRVHVLSIWPSR
jgi:hypothetical protein